MNGRGVPKPEVGERGGISSDPFGMHSWGGASNGESDSIYPLPERRGDARSQALDDARRTTGQSDPRDTSTGYKNEVSNKIGGGGWRKEDGGSTDKSDSDYSEKLKQSGFECEKWGKGEYECKPVYIKGNPQSADNTQPTNPNDQKKYDNPMGEGGKPGSVGRSKEGQGKVAGGGRLPDVERGRTPSIDKSTQGALTDKRTDGSPIEGKGKPGSVDLSTIAALNRPGWVTDPTK
jgi:hypothetical protein